MLNIRRRRGLFLIISFVSITSIQLLSQPVPCGAIAKMANNCADACVICDIDGFTGRNDLRSAGQNLGSAFCSNADDMHFIAFIAGSHNLSIKIDVSNCQAGRFNLMSLDLGFYQSSDCQNFTPITSCQRDLENGQSHIFTTEDSLIIGQHYYLIMDGSAGSVCDWTFSVLEGSTQVLPLTNSGVIIHNEETCSNFPTVFNAELNESGAALFDWTIDGQLQPQRNQNVEFNFIQDGVYEICVIASNVCDEAPPSCTTVRVRTPDTLFVNELLCEGDCREYNGTVYCETGSFQEIITYDNGCDSVIVIDLEVLPTPRTSLNVWICNDVEYPVGSSFYNSTGSYVDSIPTALGCDSVVSLELLAIECEILGTTNFEPAICHGTTTGKLIFSIDQGTPPLSFVYTNIVDTSITGEGRTELLDNNVINNVPAGMYRIYVSDNFGNDVVMLQSVSEPSSITSDFVPSEYGAYNISCHVANGLPDGTLMISVQGGVAPYDYTWNTGHSSMTITELAAGEYVVTITDYVGCNVAQSFTLEEPPLLELDVDFRNPSCDGFESGEVEILSAQGGTAPYTYAINGSAFNQGALFEDLVEGDYKVEIKDSNDCLSAISSTITAPQIPIITLENRLSILLGDSIYIDPVLNDIDIIQVNWTGPEGLTCTDCLTPYARNYNDGFYTLEVTSRDDCVTSHDLLINVEKRRRVLSANVFTPNGDGINDVLILTGGVEVQFISQWIVFDKWGNVLFSQNDFLPNRREAAWDGHLNGKKLPSGLYTWYAKVQYLDGEAIDHSGDVTLLSQ